MTTISICLVEKNPLLREGIKSFLKGSVFNVIAEYNNFEEVDAADMPVAPRLTIIGIDRQDADLPDEREGGELAAHITRLKNRFPGMRVVIMLPSQHMDDMPELFFCHADSYIPWDISPDALMNYLNLAMMGEKVVAMPATMLAAGQDNHLSDDMTGKHQLSERESDIVRCLVMGKSNKLIARELDITESTVKVHLKTILRKLGASNRTQVALWAVRNGFKQREAFQNGDHHGLRLASSA